jgi:hypothetical protein
MSIRLIAALEELRDEGILTDFNSWVTPNFYRDINTAIFRVVSTFRLLVAQECSDMKTYQDQAFEFCPLNLQEPCFVSWIKETICIALKFTARHLKEHIH